MKQKHNFTKSQGNFWESIVEREKKRDTQREIKKQFRNKFNIWIKSPTKEVGENGEDETKEIRKRSRTYGYEFSHSEATFNEPEKWMNVDCLPERKK